MNGFIPRTSFAASNSLPRSYFLGHHKVGLEKMRQTLQRVDIIIECRDYRIPISSSNPLFEEILSGKPRVLVFTKADLVRSKPSVDRTRETRLSQWYRPLPVFFSNYRETTSVQKLLGHAQMQASTLNQLTGLTMMIVGMPNVGKSSLLNGLRNLGVNRGRAAKVGSSPGVTRAMGTGVKISEATDPGGVIYLLDTPGVFVPHVAEAETMLKLALCGCVKDTVIPPEIVADYLLYRMNLIDPDLYRRFSGPTNDIDEFLTVMAQKTGRLKSGGLPDLTATALWLLRLWRLGELAPFCLDVVDDQTLTALAETRPLSMNQQRKLLRQQRILAKQARPS